MPLPYRPSRWLALVLVLVALVGVAPPARAQEPAAPAISNLDRRWDIARREASLLAQRVQTLRAEIDALAPFLDDALVADMRALADITVPAVAESPDAAAYESLNELIADARRRLRLAQAAWERAPKQDARFQSLTQAIAADVADIRNLELKQPLAARVLETERILALLDGILDRELTPERVRRYRVVYESLGLLPAGTDLREVYSSLIEGQLGGLYDDATGTLYVVDTFNPQSFFGRIILAHEICHALQDQHFPIQDLPFRTDNEDQNAATGAVLEGDATLLMMEWAVGQFRPADLIGIESAMQQSMNSLVETPPALVQGMLFPYLAGLEFFTYLMINGPPDWRDLPFREPPSSTSQILNPELYWPKRVDPINIPIPEWTGAELDDVGRGTIGEWGLRLALTPPDGFPTFRLFSTDLLANEPRAVAAAKGWRGDAFVALESNDASARCLVVRSQWASEFDAAEFAELARERRAQWGPEDAVVIRMPGSHSVDVLIASDAATLDAVDAWWKSASKLESPEATTP